MPKKRVLIVSDLHTGHLVGLTPPSRHATLAKSASPAQKKLEAVRQELWRLFALEVKALGEIHTLIVNGDAVDGDGGRSGGIELLMTDMQDQCDAAAECLKFVKAKKVYMTFGTPYHTGVNTDWERVILNEVKQSKYTEEADIKSHLYLDVNGCVFDCKHKVGSSGIPHGRRTALEREKLWAGLWRDAGVNPDVDVLVRSHVHYAGFCGAPGYLLLTTPALQGLGSRYGARQCSGIVNWGMTVFDVEESGEYSWRFITPRKANLAQKVDVLKA